LDLSLFEDFPRIIVAGIFLALTAYVADRIIGRPPGSKRVSRVAIFIGFAAFAIVYLTMGAIWPRPGRLPRGAELNEQLPHPDAGNPLAHNGAEIIRVVV
jgi:hypothetical protein